MKKVYGISVNSEQNLFAVATEDGFRIFQCNPLHQIICLGWFFVQIFNFCFLFTIIQTLLIIKC